MCVLFQSKEIKAPVKIGRFGLAIQCADGQTIQVNLKAIKIIICL